MSLTAFVQATRQTFAAGEYVVRRRYQDFVWLREQLERSYTTYIVPVCIHQLQARCNIAAVGGRAVLYFVTCFTMYVGLQ